MTMRQQTFIFLFCFAAPVWAENELCKYWKRCVYYRLTVKALLINCMVADSVRRSHSLKHKINYKIDDIFYS